jgi:hypothetical protein
LYFVDDVRGTMDDFVVVDVMCLRMLKGTELI